MSSRSSRQRLVVTFPFITCAALTLLLAMGAINTGLALLVWLLGAILSLLVLAVAVTAIMLRKIDVDRILPANGLAGEPVVVRYVITNGSRIVPAMAVNLEERGPRGRALPGDSPGACGAWIMHAGPGASMHGDAIIVPARRGVIEFHSIGAWTTFPLGLVRRSRVIDRVQTLVVFPPPREVRPGVLRSLAASGAPGLRAARRPGQGDDFFGLREYRPGDSLRSIAWKRSVSRGSLVAIERAKATPPRVRVVLDLQRAADEGMGGFDRASRGAPDAAAVRSTEAAEEDAITLAAAILRTADAEGFETGLTVVGVDALPVAVRREPRHLQRALGVLAMIDLSAPRSSGAVLPAHDRERIGIIVIHPGAIHTRVVPGEAIHLSARDIEAYLTPRGRRA